METLKTIFWIGFYLFLIALIFGIEINFSPFSIKFTSWKEGVFFIFLAIGVIGYLITQIDKAEVKGYLKGYEEGIDKGGEITDSIWHARIKETLDNLNETNNQD